MTSLNSRCTHHNTLQGLGIFGGCKAMTSFCLKPSTFRLGCCDDNRFCCCCSNGTCSACFQNLLYQNLPRDFSERIMSFPLCSWHATGCKTVWHCLDAFIFKHWLWLVWSCLPPPPNVPFASNCRWEDVSSIQLSLLIKWNEVLIIICNSGRWKRVSTGRQGHRFCDNIFPLFYQTTLPLVNCETSSDKGWGPEIFVKHSLSHIETSTDSDHITNHAFPPWGSWVLNSDKPHAEVLKIMPQSKLKVLYTCIRGQRCSCCGTKMLSLVKQFPLSTIELL